MSNGSSRHDDAAQLYIYIINKYSKHLILMGTNDQLFPLTDNTDGAAVDQFQQQHLSISKLHRLTLG